MNEIILEKFNKKEIEIINKENDFWMTAETIGFGLEYKNPRISIMKLYSSHKDELEDYASVTETVTEVGIRQTTIFNEMGIYLLIMFSKQPKAKEFRKWVINVIKNIRQKGYYIERDTKNREATLSIMKIELTQKRIINVLNHFTSFLDNFKKRLEIVEKKLPNYTSLSKGERRQKQIVEQLKTRPLTAKQLAKTQNISEKSIYVYLSILQSKGIIKAYKRIPKEPGRPAKVYKVV